MCWRIRREELSGKRVSTKQIPLFYSEVNAFPLSDAETVADKGDLEMLGRSLFWGMAMIPQGSAF